MSVNQIKKIIPGKPNKWGQIKNIEGDIVNDHMIEVEQRKKNQHLRYLFNEYSLKMATRSMDGLIEEVWTEFYKTCPYDEENKTYLPTYNNDLCIKGRDDLSYMITRALGGYM